MIYTLKISEIVHRQRVLMHDLWWDSGGLAVVEYGTDTLP